MLWTFFVTLPMIDCHNMEMAWYKHFINISLQRNFHSSDSGSLVIDCLARWGGHFPQKANVQCKSIHTFSGRKCWMFMLKDWVSYFGYKMSLDFFQQWSPRPSTTATAFVGCHWRSTEPQPKVPYGHWSKGQNPLNSRPNCNSSPSGRGESCAWCSTGFHVKL